MGIFDSLASGIKNGFSKQVGTVGVDLGDVNPQKLPVYPGWFYTAPFGQPRNINFNEIRSFSKSSWVQMVKNTIKKEVSIIPYDIISIDEEDETDYTEQIKLIKDKLNSINSDNEDIYDIILPIIDDVCDIDAGVWVKAYTTDSYTIGQIPVYDGLGNTIGERTGLILKPLGQRRLDQVRIGDGATFMRQVDIYRRTLTWYQYSFKNPANNPVAFVPDEVIYFMMNKNTQSVYGFSPVQGIQQVLELLIQATRWNKDYFKNNAIPDGIIGLPNASFESLQKFKNDWENQFKGKTHKLMYHNTAATFQQFMTSARDMEWLEGQKWYFHLVFGAFGMSPVEAGFHENINQGNQAGQERVTVRNAIKPYLTLIEKGINRNLITEILQDSNPKLQFKFLPKDHAEEQIEFEQSMQEIQAGTMTINEFRKMKGRNPIEGGDDIAKPSVNTFDNQVQQSNADAETQRQAESKPEKDFLIPYKKAFEGYMKSKGG